MNASSHVVHPAVPVHAVGAGVGSIVGVAGAEPGAIGAGVGANVHPAVLSALERSEQ